MADSSAETFEGVLRHVNFFNLFVSVDIMKG